MTQLQSSSESFAGTDQRWLGSRFGTDTTVTVTLDYTAWGAKATNGRIKSGEPMKKSGDTYIPATSAITHYLLTDVAYRTDGGDIVAPAIDRGRIVLAYLPTAVSAANVGTHFIAVEV